VHKHIHISARAQGIDKVSHHAKELARVK
jgi:hypothetical protein